MASNEATGVAACDGAPGASYTVSPVTQCCYIALLHCIILCNSIVTDTVLRCAFATLLHVACCRHDRPCPAACYLPDHHRYCADSMQCIIVECAALLDSYVAESHAASLHPVASLIADSAI